MKTVQLSVAVINGVYHAMSLKPFKVANKICSQLEELSGGFKEGQTHITVPSELANEMALFLIEEPYFEIHKIAKAFNQEVVQCAQEFKEAQGQPVQENCEKKSKK